MKQLAAYEIEWGAIKAGIDHGQAESNEKMQPTAYEDFECKTEPNRRERVMETNMGESNDLEISLAGILL